MKNKSSRRDFLKYSALTTAAGFLGKTGLASDLIPVADPFSLPPVPYDYKALEPHIDALTMEIHHSKHHQAYVKNLNDAVTKNNLTQVPLDQLIAKASTYPAAIRNNGGGHWNHTMFWSLMKPGGGGLPSGAVGDAIKNTFNSFEEFKTKFSTAAAGRFGSGWAWLVVNKGKLEIGSTPNQDNPLMDVSDLKGTPLLCLDVWEHAYYLKYQNKRPDYINAWWNLVNWDEVNRRFAETK